MSVTVFYARDMLACCWDVKQPANNNSTLSSQDKLKGENQKPTDCLCRYLLEFIKTLSLFNKIYHLVDLVVKMPISRAEDPGFESHLHCACVHGDFSGSSHTSDFKIGTPVTTLPDAWCYRVSAGTGWPGVSIL